MAVAGGTGTDDPAVGAEQGELVGTASGGGPGVQLPPESGVAAGEEGSSLLGTGQCPESPSGWSAGLVPPSEERRQCFLRA